MRICWWLLITVHLVWCSPDDLEDLYESEINVNNEKDMSEDSENESALHDDNAGNYPRTKRNSKEDEREKKQQKFHSWGGKRYGDQEDEENGENIYSNRNLDQDYLNQEDPDQYLSLVPLEKSNFSNSDDVENSQELRSKRSQQSPAFSSWAGKRDPEVVNEVAKRSTLYSSLLNNEAFATSKGDLGMKRYPSFNSWAGKRSAAFNSWGGKRAAAFNSWGGKRAAAFNSWGGKRAAAFNSWGGKRAAAFNSWGGKRDAAFNSWGGKKDAAFNSWGGKRGAAFNSWGGKRAAAFNSWGGKRAAAFNSWGGKRAAAFNSWGGKRGAAFNSWGGKRAAAFNSWGGKRAANFNSWGGKRGAAFNSWGGKREDSPFKQNDKEKVSQVEGSKDVNLSYDLDTNEYSPDVSTHDLGFSNWGRTLGPSNDQALIFENGKRAAAFNSWGGKRQAAFNSWGGKRYFADGDKMHAQMYSSGLLPQFQSGMLIKYEYDNPTTSDNLIPLMSKPVSSQYDRNSMLKPDGISLENYINYSKTLDNLQNFEPHKFKDTFNEDNDRSDELKGTEEENVLNAKRGLSEDRPSNLEHSKELLWASNDGQMEKKDKPFSSWAGKRSPLFSSWYGNKIPTMLLSSGKRRPAFSSWGGKRSMPITESNRTPSGDCTISNILKYGRQCHETNEGRQTDEEEMNIKDSEEEKVYERKKREINCDANNFMFTDRRGGCRDKRVVGENVKKNRVITRMYLQGGLTWPMTFKSFPRTMDFYAWGGKRSL